MLARSLIQSFCEITWCELTRSDSRCETSNDHYVKSHDEELHYVTLCQIRDVSRSVLTLNKQALLQERKSQSEWPNAVM